VINAGIILAIIAGLAVNECCDVCLWAARALVRWSARLRYPDPARAHVRAEELAAHIYARPGKLLKLGTAVGFVTVAVVAAACRAVGRPTPTLNEHASTAMRMAAVEALGQALRDFADIRALPPRRRRGFRSLTTVLQKLLGIDPVDALKPCLERDKVLHGQAKDLEIDELDWNRLIDTLDNGGFDGVVAVEHEDPVWSGSEEKIKQGLDIAAHTLRPLILEPIEDHAT